MKHVRTEQFARQWGSSEMPTAEVVHGRLPVGEHPAMAVLAWVEQRTMSWPVLGLRLAVLSQELDRTIGVIGMGLPLSPKTERHVCCLLEELGWDSRVWPYSDHGWPEGAEEEAKLLGVLRKGKIGATLTFPPHPKGHPTILIPVLKRKGPYLCCPFSDGPVVPRFLESLRALAADPKPFVSDWAVAH